MLFLVALLMCWPLVFGAETGGRLPSRSSPPGNWFQARNFVAPVLDTAKTISDGMSGVANMANAVGAADVIGNAMSGKRGDDKQLGDFFQLAPARIEKAASMVESLAGTMTGAVNPLASTTTTTPAPVDEIKLNLEKLGKTVLDSVQLVEAPMKLMNGLLTNTATISTVGAQTLSKASDNLVAATDLSRKLITPDLEKDGSRKGSPQAHRDYSSNYEFLPIADPFEFRKPKYFSKECQFRFACEVGKMSKPVAAGVAKSVYSNRLVQDLHNRYTRAFTYGTLNENCDRYYCAILQMLNGPVGFASGMSELVNRFLNRDLYDGYEEQV